MLRKLYEFDIPTEDLVLIYTLYIRSVLEFNLNVWFASITNEERENIERMEWMACKIILKHQYSGYQQALDSLNLQSLSDRRQLLAKRFAIKCSKSDKFSDLYPLNQNDANLRSEEKYKVQFCKKWETTGLSYPSIAKTIKQTKV